MAEDDREEMPIQHDFLDSFSEPGVLTTGKRSSDIGLVNTCRDKQHCLAQAPFIRRKVVGFK